MKLTKNFTGVLLLACLPVGGIHAESTPTNHTWEYTLTPLFLWGMSVNGTSTIGPVSAPLDIEFKDAVSDMEAVFTLHYEMRKDDLTLFAEYQFIDLGPNAELPNGAELDVSFKNKMGELGAAYSLGGSETTDWQILGGARWTSQKLGVEAPTGRKLVDVDENWWDGFIGGRVIAEMSPKWRFLGRADIGAGGSDLVWNVAGFFDYRFRDWGSALIGYRWLDYDYDNGEKGPDHYAYDATQQGPLLGLSFYW